MGANGLALQANDFDTRVQLAGDAIDQDIILVEGLERPSRGDSSHW